MYLSLSLSPSLSLSRERERERERENDDDDARHASASARPARRGHDASTCHVWYTDAWHGATALIRCYVHGSRFGDSRVSTRECRHARPSARRSVLLITTTTTTTNNNNDNDNDKNDNSNTTTSTNTNNNNNSPWHTVHSLRGKHLSNTNRLTHVFFKCDK